MTRSTTYVQWHSIPGKIITLAFEYKHDITKTDICCDSRQPIGVVRVAAVAHRPFVSGTSRMARFYRDHEDAPCGRMKAELFLCHNSIFFDEHIFHRTPCPLYGRYLLVQVLRLTRRHLKTKPTARVFTPVNPPGQTLV